MAPAKLRLSNRPSPKFRKTSRRVSFDALEDRRLLSLSTFDSIDGASQVRATYGVNGSGMTAAVIDMGVDYQDTALGGGFGPGNKVVAGYDFADSSPNPVATSSQHGTAVAGILASSDPSNPGVAPGADVVPLKVFSNSNQGNFAWVAQALQWVVANHQANNITVVNISIEDGNNYAGNWFANDGSVGEQITNLIGQLDGMNIPVVVAAGNSYSGAQGMGFPAIVSDAISVTATNGANQLASDAQRLGSNANASGTTLAAPGVNLTSIGANNQSVSVTGTSFAAPQVSGAVILLQQIYESRFGSLPSVAQLKQWLTQGSDPVSDPSTGLTFDRLDIPKAAALIPQPAAQTTPANPTPSTSTGQQVAVYVNGQLQGQFSQAQANSSFGGVLSVLNQLGSFQTVQVWNAGQSGTSLGAGTTWTSIQIWNAKAAGTVASEHAKLKHQMLISHSQKVAQSKVESSISAPGSSAARFARSSTSRLLDAGKRVR